MVNVQIFFCPSGNKGSTYSCDYGFNRNLCPDLRTSGRGQMLAEIKAPANVFMCLDAGPYMVSQGHIASPSGSFWYVPGCWDPACDPDGVGYNSAHPLGGFAQMDYKEGRHNGGVNVGFADGHGKWLASQYLMGNLQHWYP